MKILVCDDALSSRELLGAYLKQMGHCALFAEDGQQAVEMFVKESPDLVLVDIEMPKMDGYQVTRSIRQSLNELAKWIPIIFISSYVDDASIVKGIEAGADDYLTKPVTLAMLQAKVSAMQRLSMMRENLINFGKQLREINDDLLHSNRLLSELSLKDPLTRLGNRRAFEETFDRVTRLMIREHKPMSLILVDVDDFKLFNDTYGHQMGDSCLEQIGRVLKQGILRPEDFVARYGGEEFAIILAATDLPGAMHVAERLRIGIEAMQIPNKNASYGIVTISMGVASFSIDEHFDKKNIVMAADKALYEAKQRGRNCIVAAKLDFLNNENRNQPPFAS